MNFSGIDVDTDGVFRDNHSIDYDDYEYNPEDDAPEGMAVWLTVIYSLITIVGLLGNGLILAILVKKRRAWRMSDTIVLHLCLVDLLLLLTLPFWATQASHSRGWCFGLPLCRFIAAVFNINYFFGFLLLGCISLDQLLSIIYTKRLFVFNSPRNALIGCLVAWLVSLLLTVPDLGSTKVKKDPVDDIRSLCVPNFYLPEWQRPSRLFHHVLSFAAALVVCSSSVLLWVQQSAKSLVKRRSVVIVHASVLVFILCWTPYNIVLLVDTSRNGAKDQQETFSSLGKHLAATAALGCFHACLRPALYLGLCKNFREETLAIHRCGEFKGSLWELGLSEGPLVCQNVDKEELEQMNVESPVKATQC